MNTPPSPPLSYVSLFNANRTEVAYDLALWYEGVQIAIFQYNASSGYNHKNGITETRHNCFSDNKWPPIGCQLSI